MFDVASVAAYQNNVIMLILDKDCLLEMPSSQTKDHMHPSDCCISRIVQNLWLPGTSVVEPYKKSSIQSLVMTKTSVYLKLHVMAEILIGAMKAASVLSINNEQLFDY